jgi:putative nucleotidyltransferase with HDIG domain
MEFDRRATTYVIGIILLGAMVIAWSVSDLVRQPVGMEWLVLAALTVASGWATLRIPGMPISFSISDTFSIAAALLFGPSAGAITAALDGLVLSIRMSSSQHSGERVLFNLAAPAVATWTAAHVFFALGGSQFQLEGPMSALRLLGLLMLFATIDFGLNSGMVATAVGFERGRPILSIWRQHFSDLWINYFGGVYAAMLLMLFARLRTIDLLILMIPLPVILYVTFRHALGRAQDHVSHLGKVNLVYIAAIEALAHAVDAKDQVTHDHIRRVQDESVRLARALGVTDEGEIQAINAAALLHDVGKLAIPEHILNKPGRLTPAEYEIMKRHASIGADILSVIDFPYAVVPIVRHHHENWDGSGYPDGLAGERVPIGSRILAVVDCFDALTSDRPYRPRMADRDALQIVADRRGTMYDPRVVDAFFTLHGSVDAPVSRSATAETATKSPVPLVVEKVEDALEGCDLRTFFDLGRALDGPMSPARAGEVLWTHLRPHLPADRFVFFAYESSGDAIVPAYQAGSVSGLASRIAVGDRLSGWVAAAGQTIVNSDARLDLDESERDGSSLRSALAVPVASEGRVIGVLSFYACAPDAFQESHRRIAQAAAWAVSERVFDGKADLRSAAPGNEGRPLRVAAASGRT